MPQPKIFISFPRNPTPALAKIYFIHTFQTDIFRAAPNQNRKDSLRFLGKISREKAIAQ